MTKKWTERCVSRAVGWCSVLHLTTKHYNAIYEDDFSVVEVMDTFGLFASNMQTLLKH